MDNTTPLPLNPCRLRAAGILATAALLLAPIQAHPGHDHAKEHSPSQFVRTISGQAQINLLTLEKDGIRLFLTCDQVTLAHRSETTGLQSAVANSDIVLASSPPPTLPKTKLVLLPDGSPHKTAMAALHHHAARGSHTFTVLLPLENTPTFEVQLLNQGFRLQSNVWLTTTPPPSNPK